MTDTCCWECGQAQSMTAWRLCRLSNFPQLRQAYYKEGPSGVWRPPVINEICCIRERLAELLDDVAVSGPDVLYNGSYTKAWPCFNVVSRQLYHLLQHLQFTLSSSLESLIPGALFSSPMLSLKLPLLVPLLKRIKLQAMLWRCVTAALLVMHLLFWPCMPTWQSTILNHLHNRRLCRSEFNTA